MADAYDLIVVGGGTAGCVIATRLSEEPGRRVLLIEAGPDYGGLDRVPDELRTAQGPTFTHDWGFRSEAVNGRVSRRLPRGRVLGGCSSTNAAVAVRGAPGDFDRWVDHGAAGWGWDEVLPWFRHLETDLDMHDPWHGTQGPLPIRRYTRDELSPVHQRALDAAAGVGHADVHDHNAPGAIGSGRAPVNARDGERISDTAAAYLWPSAHRTNLTVRADQLVASIDVEDDAARGVVLATGERIRARTVVIAAGAFGSPATLLRSGIGPRDQLARLGIDTKVDLPAVGENLQDHPIVALAWTAPLEAVGGPAYQTFVTMAPDDRGAPRIQLLPGSARLVAGSSTEAVWTVAAVILKPWSRGSLTLTSADGDAPLRIDIGHLDDDRDLELMRTSVHAARELTSAEPLGSLRAGSELTGLPDVDDTGFAAAARAAVSTYHHAAGTSAMGDGPASSVVGPDGSVHGVSGLYVVDASVMPEIPSANTNVPTIMIAEKLSVALVTASDRSEGVAGR